MKPLQTLILISLFTFSLASKGEVLRFPQACTSGILEISNLKNLNLRVWLQKFSPLLISENELTLKPLSTMRFNLTVISSEDRFSILNLNATDSIKVSLTCNKKIYPAHSFEGGYLTFAKSDLPQNKIWLQNLFIGQNSFSIELLDAKMNLQSKFRVTLKSNQSTNFNPPTRGVNWTHFRISAKERFTAYNLTSNGSASPVFVSPQESKVDRKAAYFLVEQRTGETDSYIVRIIAPLMIARARQQVADPSLEQILFAKIEKGSQGFNRNWSKFDKSFWSWSVSEVTNFADLGSTSCNGFPQAVEDRVDQWVTQPGQTCFWSYRIRKELKPEEVAAGVSLP